jgi:hypothetical protein
MSETAYDSVAESMHELDIPFARADAPSLKGIVAESGLESLPSIVLYKKKRPIKFKGVHIAEAIIAFVKKQIGPPYELLREVDDVVQFLNRPQQMTYALSSVMVVGFFSDHESVEEDDYEDFMEAAKDLQVKEDIHFGVVIDAGVAEFFKKNKTIDRTPSIQIAGEKGLHSVINFDELYGENIGVKGWITQQSIPLVGKLTGANFQLYEKRDLPMLLMFLDLEHEKETTTPGVVGGKSGGVLNELLLDELREVAKEHREKISFVYVNGVEHEDQMKSLGLYGGKERLPAIAFNTKSASKIPFSEKLPINKDTLLQFCADYLSGKLKSKADSEEMAKKALMSTTPINRKNSVKRKDRRAPPDQRTGIAEQFGDGNVGDTAVVIVTEESFETVVMDEKKDVLLLLHAKECEPCAHLSVYYKRMAQRFKDLKTDSLVIARMDVTEASPPADLQLMAGELPIIVLLPATAGGPGLFGGPKLPPWDFFSGLGKVQVLMRWVEAHVGIKFKLPNLPHLTEEQVEAFKVQVREREEHLDEERKKEQHQMEAEEAARKAADRKREERGKEEDGRKGEETEIVDGADKDAGTSVDERTKKETQSTRTAKVQNFEAEAATFESSEEDDSEF